MKYESKTELIEDVGRQRLLLLETLEGIPEAQRTEPGVWGDGWTVVDLVAHLEAGHFAWTGKSALVTYAGANTASHYRFGLKVLKRWLRQRT